VKVNEQHAQVSLVRQPLVLIYPQPKEVKPLLNRQAWLEQDKMLQGKHRLHNLNSFLVVRD
jgi:hypothetical protein